jgi:hypothetical protein
MQECLLQEIARNAGGEGGSGGLSGRRSRWDRKEQLENDRRLAEAESLLLTWFGIEAAVRSLDECKWRAVEQFAPIIVFSMVNNGIFRRLSESGNHIG